MASIKVTFTLDQTTVGRLRDTAQRLAKSKSEVVREAIHEYHARLGKLSERERLRLLHVFDDLVPRIPSRPVREVDQEIRTLRRLRRHGGRQSAPRGSA